MFKRKSKNNKVLEKEVLIDENIEESTAVFDSEELERSFSLNLEETKEKNQDESIIKDDFDIEDDYSDEIINLDGNGRKSYIEEEDLKFKEVIEDIKIEEELGSNLINISEDNEIIIEESLVEMQSPEDLDIDEEALNDEISPADTSLIPQDEGKIVSEDKDLKKYFDSDAKKVAKKLAKKPAKKTKAKRTSKRAFKQKQVYDDIQNQRVYKFRGKKYSKVEDFIKFLNDNYLDIDQISKEVLDDKAFYGFIAKKSGVFDASIKRFKILKEEIGE